MEDTTNALATQQQAAPSGDGTSRQATPSVAAPQSAPPAQMPSIEGVEDALLEGDLAQLTPQQRISYYEKVCQSVGLNPLTRPFEYIELNGKLTLYAKKDATEQLRRLSGVSITKLETEQRDGIYIIRAHAIDKDGRTDVSTGAVSLPRGGDALANAYMKAETKAKRRVTLSIVGMGWLDETELSTIPSARAARVDHETGEIAQTRLEDRRPNSTAARLDEMERRMREADADQFEEAAEVYQEWVEERGWLKKDRAELDRRIEQVRADRASELGEKPADATRDAEQPDEVQPEPAAERSFERDLEKLESKLKKAMRYDTPGARQRAVSSAMKGFAEVYPTPSEERRAQIMAVYEPVCRQLAGTQDEEAETYDPDAPPALSKEDTAPRTELPEGFPHAKKLRGAGITTAEGVLAASSIDGLDSLEDVGGIGESYAGEARAAAERLLETGDWRSEAIQQQAEDLEY